MILDNIPLQTNLQKGGMVIYVSLSISDSAHIWFISFIYLFYMGLNVHITLKADIIQKLTYYNLWKKIERLGIFRYIAFPIKIDH